MQEFCEPSVQFIDGALSTQPPRAGRARIRFPDPIGAADCVYTLHSEPATLPDYFHDKGIRRVCWRLGLPAPLEGAILTFASAGLDSVVPLAVGNASVAPIDVLAASIERTMATSARPTDAYTEYGCLHVEVTGLRAQQPTRLVFRCPIHWRWKLHLMKDTIPTVGKGHIVALIQTKRTSVTKMKSLLLLKK